MPWSRIRSPASARESPSTTRARPESTRPCVAAATPPPTSFATSLTRSSAEPPARSSASATRRAVSTLRTTVLRGTAVATTEQTTRATPNPMTKPTPFTARPAPPSRAYRFPTTIPRRAPSCPPGTHYAARKRLRASRPQKPRSHGCADSRHRSFRRWPGAGASARHAGGHGGGTPSPLSAKGSASRVLPGQAPFGARETGAGTRNPSAAALTQALYWTRNIQHKDVDLNAPLLWKTVDQHRPKPFRDSQVAPTRPDAQ